MIAPTLVAWRRIARRHLVTVAAVAAAGTLAACGGGVTDAPRVGSIEVSPPTVSVRAGSNVPLGVVVRDPSGSAIDRATVFWSSSDTAVAVVSSSGVVTARRAGTATIAATASGMSGTSAVTVANRDVANVTLTPAAASIRVGATTPLEARTYDAEGELLGGRTVVFTTSNAAVATVSGTGIVTGVAPGNATITATSEGRSATAAVTVTLVPIATITVAPGTNTLGSGESAQLTATPRDAGGAALTGRVIAWSSSDTRVATVSSNGLLVAVSPGTATITAASEGRSGTASVTVNARPVDRVVVTPAEPSVVVGASLQLAAQATDASGNVLTGRSVSWTSGNSAVATVNATGAVTGVAPGTVTITATSEGKSGSVSVRVTPERVATVTVSPPSATLVTGRTQQLTAVARSSSGGVLSGRTVVWRSGSTNVATVSASGLVTAIAPGTAVIIADVEGETGSSTVTVRAPEVATVTITPANPTLAPLGSVQLVATARDADGNTITGRTVTWSSSDELTAFVSSSGGVLAFRPGTATITATIDGVRATTVVTVR